jgi:hypothetical protein
VKSEISFTIAVLLTLLAVEAGAAPVLDMKEHAVDFGWMPPTADTTHRFIISNTGDQDLEIYEVDSECPCTWAEITGDVIAPGDTASIILTFVAKGLEGRVERIIEVSTNDPDNLFVDIDVCAYVDNELEISPRMLDLGVVSREELGRGEYDVGHVTVSENPDLEITHIDSNNPSIWVVFDGDSPLDLEDPLPLELRLDPQTPPGLITGKLFIHTSDSRRPPAVVKVSGVIEGDVRVSPRRSLAAGNAARGGVFDQMLSVDVVGDKEVNITETYTTVAGVRAILEHENPGGGYRIKLFVEPEAGLGKAIGDVVIETDHPQESIITIPFYGTIRESEM